MSRLPIQPLKALRSDATDVQDAPDPPGTRSRVLFAALKLFSEKGFSQTSTREIAAAANANIGAISYYFGDKAGLYRAVFTEPLGSEKDNIPRYDQPHFTLRESLEGFFASFLEPMKLGELMQQCVRLHNRELIEPTGVWADEVEQGIKPAQMALVSVLRRHLNLAQVDDDLHRLAFAIAAPALQMLLCRDVFVAIAPQLVASPAAIDQAALRMADFAESMVAGEQARRASEAIQNIATNAKASRVSGVLKKTVTSSASSAVKNQIKKPQGKTA